MQSTQTRHRFLLVAAVLALLTLAVADAGWAQAQFQGVVTSISQQNRTLTLNNGQMVRIRASTVFDPEGDVFSWPQLVGAFNSGLLVSVEGDGQFRPNGVIVAFFIKAETNA